MLLIILKISSDERTAALMESINGSICSEATQPWKVIRNDSDHASGMPDNLGDVRVQERAAMRQSSHGRVCWAQCA